MFKDGFRAGQGLAQRVADGGWQALGRDLRLVEMGWPIGMALCRPVGGGLWEVRTSLTSNRIARVIFCATQGHMVLLHGFIKKTQKTPSAELDLARTRQKEVDL